MGEKTSLKVSFGSCYGKPGFESNIFSTIAEGKPDLFVWLGDAAYVEEDPSSWYTSISPEHIQKRFHQTKLAEGYDKLQRIVGVWDDNDFGKNDGGAEYKDRERNRDLYLDFIGEPTDSDRRTQRDSPIH